MRARYPAIDVDPDPIFVRDGNVWTSAGVTAGIDLALALVEDDHGVDVAQLVARWLVMFLRRPGGQTQFATPVWNDRPPPGPIRAAQESIEADPGGDHRVVVLAERVGMSERHFIRCFSSSVGATPAQYVAAVRTEAARRAVESTPDTVEVIARRCGFGSGETMRRTFARRLGVSPRRLSPPVQHMKGHPMHVAIPLFPRFTASTASDRMRCCSGSRRSTSRSSVTTAP